MRLADYVIEFLVNHGIHDVFLVTGGGSIFMSDAITLNKKMRFYACHHEQAVAMATEGYARVKRKIGFSLVTTGPGGTNAITGVAGSWIDSVPHLIISGQAFLSQTIGNSGLRQLGVQEINIIDIVKPITKYAVIIEDPKTIRYHLEKALYIAQSGRPGPVWLDLPADIQNAKLDIATLIGFDPKTETKSICLDPEFSEKIKKVSELLKSAKRPIVHIGQGVRIAGAEEEFLKFIETYQLPFVTARNANDMVDWEHVLYVGRPGTYAQRAANFAIQNCDFYLAIGTRLSLPQTGFNTKDFARNAKTKIMIDIDPSELNKKSLYLDIRIQSDAKIFLNELLKSLDGTTIEVSAWIKQCQQWKKKYPVVLPHYKDQKNSVNSYYFTDLLSDLLSSTDVIVTDMGLAFQGTHQALRTKKGQRFFTNSGFAAMGWGLPAAVGACIAHNKQRTVCIAGEGGLMLNIQELATIAHHRLPIKLFIYNNGGYLTIKQTQEIGFENRLIGINPDTGLSFPDMLKVAESHGIPAVRINSHDKLSENIQKVLVSEGPFVCELMLDHNQEQVPKVCPRKLPDGRIERTPLEDLYPFLDRKELAENMIAEIKKHMP